MSVCFCPSAGEERAVAVPSSENLKSKPEPGLLVDQVDAGGLPCTPLVEISRSFVALLVPFSVYEPSDGYCHELASV